MSPAIRMCAWCDTVLGAAGGDFSGRYPITHGICEPCANGQLTTGGVARIRSMLDGLGAPVLMLDGDSQLQGGNREIEALLGRSAEELAGLKAGDAIGCVNALTKEGCGHTADCPKCAIRNSVKATFESGTPCVGVVEHREVLRGEERQTMTLRISTERVGASVLVRVDEVALVPSAPPVGRSNG